MTQQTPANSELPQEVSVEPDMRFYNLLESYPYTPTSALCEFIDNALQEFLLARERKEIPDSEKLDIEILFRDEAKGKSSITICDHGVGIAASEIQRALKPAYKPKDKSLSEFGIGMKAAAIWFGRKWQLTSQPISGVQGYFIQFDLDKLLEENARTIPVTGIKKNDSPGVTIEIEKLKNPVTRELADECWRDLQEIYQIYILADQVLTLSVKFNDTLLPQSAPLREGFFDALTYQTVDFRKNPDTKKDQQYAFGEAKTWRQDINFVFNGNTVHGFLSVLKQSSQKQSPGIRLFRYKRLIRGTSDMPYRPILLLGTANKHAPSRVYGELHLDGQPISNHKGNFQFDEAFFLEVLKSQPGIKEIISQAELYRSQEVKDGNVISFKTYEDYENAVLNKRGVRKKRTATAKSSTATTKTTISTLPPQPTPQGHTQIDTLNSITFSSSLSLLHIIKKETVELYESARWWPFCLCYRIVLEVGIIEKIKKDFTTHHRSIYDKSIDSLLKYLSANRSTIIDPVKYKSFNHSLRDGGKILGNLPGIAILNLASHGNYQPSRADVDSLLANTQELLLWMTD